MTETQTALEQAAILPVQEPPHDAGPPPPCLSA